MKATDLMASNRQLLAEASLELGQDVDMEIQTPSAGNKYDYEEDEDEYESDEDESDENRSSENTGREGRYIKRALLRSVLLVLHLLNYYLCLDRTKLRRRTDKRTRLIRLRNEHESWAAQIPALVAAYMQWKHGSAVNEADVPTASARHIFEATMVGIGEFFLATTEHN